MSLSHPASRPHRWLAVAAVGIAATASVAACGGGSSKSGATNDAAAACDALARSTGVTNPNLTTSNRLQGAAYLGLAAAGEDPDVYTNLAAPMQKLRSDISADATAQLQNDFKSAQAACKADKLSS